MDITNSRNIGEYKAELFEHPGFEEDFPNWMAEIAKKEAKECFEDFMRLKNKHPECCFADGRVSFEVKVSIINDP